MANETQGTFVQEPQKYKARLIAGKHYGDNGEEYVVGEVVESKVNLIKAFGPEKFGMCEASAKPSKGRNPALPPAETPAPEQQQSDKQEALQKSQLETLQAMSLQELKAWADGEEIFPEVKNAKTKEEAIKIIAKKL